MAVPVTDVSVGLDDGLIAVAQPGGLVVVDPDARVVAAHRVPAIERLAAAGELLAYV